MPRAKRERDPTNRDRQARYHSRMRAAGYVRFGTWIHRDDVDSLSQSAERLRKKRARAEQ
jgi:hypothetical protein